MSTALVVQLNQAAINGIRAAGAKQTINVEGNGLSPLMPTSRNQQHTDISNSVDWCLDMDHIQGH